MADAYGYGHELGPRDTDPWWRVGDRPPKQSVVLWLAEHTDLPTVDYPVDDLSQPPSMLVEFQPAAGGSRPAPDGSEQRA